MFESKHERGWMTMRNLFAIIGPRKPSTLNSQNAIGKNTGREKQKGWRIKKQKSKKHGVRG